MATKYAFKDYNKETMARTISKDLGVSTKHSIEICSRIRRKSVEKAKLFLENVIKMKTPVSFTRFNKGVGHRKGKLAAGRYPIKAASEILSVLNSAEKNAQQKGLNSSDLIIKHICANLASRPWRYGRIRRRKAKRTHVEVVLAEKKSKQAKKEKTEEKEIKEGKPVEKKQEIKAKLEEKKPVEEKVAKKEKKTEPKAVEEKKAVKEEKQIKKSQDQKSKEKKAEVNIKK